MSKKSDSLIGKKFDPAKYSDDKNYISGYLMIFKLLGIFLAFLIIISLIRKVNAGTPVTFSSFLNWLGDVNSFHLGVNISDFTISSDWGMFNFFKEFLNIFTTSFGVISFIGSNLINLLVFLGQFLLFLFA